MGLPDHLICILRNLYAGQEATLEPNVEQQTGKFFKRWEYQNTLPAFWEICMQVKKQQLLELDMELDMEQQTGSK